MECQSIYTHKNTHIHRHSDIHLIPYYPETKLLKIYNAKIIEYQHNTI